MGALEGGRQDVIVVSCYAISRLDLFRKDRELFQKDCGLQRIQAPVDAHPHIVVLVSALPMNAKRSDHLRGLPIVSENGTPVAVASQRLGGKEACNGNIANCADSA